MILARNARVNRIRSWIHSWLPLPVAVLEAVLEAALEATPGMRWIRDGRISGFLTVFVESGDLDLLK